MNAFALVAGLAGELSAAAKAQKQTPAGSEQGSLESWMTELNSAFKQSAKSSSPGISQSQVDEEKRQSEQRRDQSTHHPDGHGVWHQPHATALHAVAPEQVHHAQHSSHAHPVGAHATPVVSHLADLTGQSQHGLHTTGVVQLHGLSAELHHAAVHANVPPAVAQSHAHGHPVAALSVSPLSARPAVDPQGFSATNALTALLEASMGTGDVTQAALRIIPADEKALQQSLDVAGATRRKLMDAMEDLGAASGLGRDQASDADTPVSGDLPGGLSASGAGGVGIDALSDRPVTAAADLNALMMQADRAPGQADGLRGPEALSAVNADLDWMAILEQQAGLSQLRDTDQLRLDVQLQGNERLALEASLVDGVLTVRLGARDDGGVWIAPEQMEALKASLQAASGEVQDVVFEQSADLGSDTGADANGDQRSARSDEGSERRSGEAGGRDRSDQGRQSAAQDTLSAGRSAQSGSRGVTATDGLTGLGSDGGGVGRVGDLAASARLTGLTAGSVSLRA